MGCMVVCLATVHSTIEIHFWGSPMSGLLWVIIKLQFYTLYLGYRSSVCRQIFWARGLPELRDGLAHLRFFPILLKHRIIGSKFFFSGCSLIILPSSFTVTVKLLHSSSDLSVTNLDPAHPFRCMSL